MFDRNPNLYGDISARFGELAPIPRFVTQFIEKHQDRLLYGTDMGYNELMFSTTFRILETHDEHFIAYNLGNLWRRLALPKKIENWSLTILQQRLVKTGGRLVKHARLLLADAGREPSDQATVRKHGTADGRAEGGDWVAGRR